MVLKLNLEGVKRGRLTIIKEAERSKTNKTRWLCKCECGNEKIIPTSDLRHGNVRSCGCLAKEHSRNINLHHGHSINGKTTSEYNSWMAMKNRCLNKKYKEFKYWGGRGITVYQPWVESFELFLKHMGPKPSKDYSIDRFPDKNGNYEPGNCRWANEKEQQNNRRNNRWLELNGMKMTVTQWALFFGVTQSVISGHLRNGKTIEQMFLFYRKKRAILQKIQKV